MIYTLVKLQTLALAFQDGVSDRWEGRHDERGQTTIEYLGILALVAAIIGVLFAAGIVGKATTLVTKVVNDIFGSGPT